MPFIIAYLVVLLSAAPVFAKKAESIKHMPLLVKLFGNTKRFKIKEKQVPAWTQMSSQVCHSSDNVPIFLGVGVVSGIKNLALARTAADNRARAEIAKLINSKVTISKTKDSTTIKTITTAALQQVEIIDHFFDDEGNIYALARAPALTKLDNQQSANNLCDITKQNKKLRTLVVDYEKPKQVIELEKIIPNWREAPLSYFNHEIILNCIYMPYKDGVSIVNLEATAKSIVAEHIFILLTAISTYYAPNFSGELIKCLKLNKDNVLKQIISASYWYSDSKQISGCGLLELYKLKQIAEQCSPEVIKSLKQFYNAGSR
ncbi:MAG: hypothetical protein JW841_04820 [Deltaproteobacteria bacterium]|nr:hypothetical protein [Deltaproteobacteria bacterium]